MATTRLMPLHIGEGRSFSTAIEDIIDYVENPEKTDYGKLIYGFECDTRTADAEFTLAKRHPCPAQAGGARHLLRGQDRPADDPAGLRDLRLSYRHGSQQSAEHGPLCGQ